MVYGGDIHPSTLVAHVWKGKKHHTFHDFLKVALSKGLSRRYFSWRNKSKEMEEDTFFVPLQFFVGHVIVTSSSDLVILWHRCTVAVEDTGLYARNDAAVAGSKRIGCLSSGFSQMLIRLEFQMTGLSCRVLVIYSKCKYTYTCILVYLASSNTILNHYPDYGLKRLRIVMFSADYGLDL